MSTEIRLKDDIVYREIDGEIVVLNLASGDYVAFDAIASRIWRLIEEFGSLPLVKSGLLAEYDLDEETCQTELDAFVRTLHEKGLIAITADDRPAS